MNLQVCAGKGQHDTKLYSGVEYHTTDFKSIVEFAKAPYYQGDKSDGFWIIPSTYNQFNARTASVQFEKGSFPILWADIDKGPPTIDEVAAAVRAITESEFLIYTTYSHDGITNFKYRVLIPIANPIPGIYYSAAATALNDLLELYGFGIDRVNQGPNQICYLPNPRGNYAYHYEPGSPYLFRPGHRLSDETKAVAEKLATEEEKRPVLKPGRERGNFNHLYPIEYMLARHGFETNNGGRDWHHASQTTGSYATRVWNDGGWSTLSTTVKELLGREWGDAFDIFCRLDCQNNEPYAQRCAIAIPYGWRIGDDPEAIIKAHEELGAKLYANMRVNGEPIGPVLQNEISTAALQAAESVLPKEVKLSQGEWDFPWPPGITGELAQYMYHMSKKPIRQFAIAYTLHLISGLCARRYQCGSIGPQLYFLLSAETGRGKGQARKVMLEQIVKDALTVKTLDPNLSKTFDNQIPASGSGFRQLFTRTPYPLVAMSEEDAHDLLRLIGEDLGQGGQIKKLLLGLFDMGGRNFSIAAKEYASKDDSTPSIHRPVFTMIIDTQPTYMKEFLGKRHVRDSGLAARIMIIEYNGIIKPTNSIHYPIPEYIINRLADIWQAFRMNPDQVVDIEVAPEVKQAMKEFDELMTRRMNENDVLSKYLSRIWINALKVACNLAVFENHITPKITLEHWNWSRDFSLKIIERIINMVEDGEVGGGEMIRLATMVDAVRQYVKMKPTTRLQYRVPKSVVDLKHVIPHGFLLRYLKNNAAFQGSEQGKTTQDHIEKTLQELIKAEVLTEVTRESIMMQYQVVLAGQVRTKFYTFGDAWEG
jgi:hypothetical protein